MKKSPQNKDMWRLEVVGSILAVLLSTFNSFRLYPELSCSWKIFILHFRLRRHLHRQSFGIVDEHLDPRDVFKEEKLYSKNNPFFYEIEINFKLNSIAYVEILRN